MTSVADTGTARVSRLATEKWGDGILRLSALSIRGGAGVFEWALADKGIRTVLEIGTYRGVSAAAMAQYVDRVVTIDLKRGLLDQKDPSFDRREFWESLEVSNVELILVNDDAEKKTIVDAMEFDFAFIDGCHDARVRNDFELVKRCGRVLFHDADDNRKRGFKQHAPNDVFEFLETLPQEQLEFKDIFCLWTAP